MKHFKKILSVLAVLALCLTPLFSTPLTANAAGGTTYYVKYVPSLNTFRYQVGTWEDGKEHIGLDLLTIRIKDGDLLVIEDTNNIGINLSVDVSLSNLTIVDGDSVIVSAKKITDFYALNGSVSAINGDISNAYIYDNSVANLNNNVNNVTIINSKGDLLEATVAVVGTCDHIVASGKSYKHFEHYSFKANTLYVEKGVLKTAAENYSKTPTTTNTTPSTPSNEYDDVPKTADVRFNPMWLVLAGILCLAGSIGVRKIK